MDEDCPDHPRVEVAVILKSPGIGEGASILTTGVNRDVQCGDTEIDVVRDSGRIRKSDGSTTHDVHDLWGEGHGAHRDRGRGFRRDNFDMTEPFSLTIDGRSNS